MITREVFDRDGRILYFAGESVSQIRRLAIQIHAQAELLDCNMRNIPRLGAPAGGDWHPTFRVTEENGAVVRIERMRRIARPRDPT